VLDHLGDALLRILGQDAVAEMWSKHRTLECEKFKTGMVKVCGFAVCLYVLMNSPYRNGNVKPATA